MGERTKLSCSIARRWDFFKEIEIELTGNELTAHVIFLVQVLVFVRHSSRLSVSFPQFFLVMTINLGHD